MAAERERVAHFPPNTWKSRHASGIGARRVPGGNASGIGARQVPGGNASGIGSRRTRPGEGRAAGGVEDTGVASRVYVIELTADAGRRRDPRIPWVYVGSSARDPEIRFAQHRRGYKSARLVKRFALRLRPDLYEDLPSFRGSRAAQAAEAERARDLAATGFVAHCDGTSYGRDGGFWDEWDDERLALAGTHADAAAAELLESSFSPLSDLDCARLLHGERGFWTDGYIDRADPPPAYGLLSHVRLDALVRRVEALRARCTMASASSSAASGA